MVGIVVLNFVNCERLSDILLINIVALPSDLHADTVG